MISALPLFTFLFNSNGIWLVWFLTTIGCFYQVKSIGLLVKDLSSSIRIELLLFFLISPCKGMALCDRPSCDELAETIGL